MAAGAVMITASPAELEGGLSLAAEQKLGDPRRYGHANRCRAIAAAVAGNAAQPRNRSGGT